MADEKQLAILWQGIEAWKKWREAHPGATVDLSEVDFSEEHLEGANFSYADLMAADLAAANLRDADLSYSDLAAANLTNANLTNANLAEADLFRANLTNANLTEANLTNAKFGKANLTGCKISSTVFGNNNLSSSIGLETTKHYGPSTIGVDTIRLSRGELPIEFLRGCGLSDLDIEYAKLSDPRLDPDQVTQIVYEMHRLYLGQPLQFYSCFISYSSKDHRFAQRLHDDLQNTGVRCWFAPEDIKIGDQIRPTIDREIRLRDKLLVILSENSIKSEWVGDEVEAALEEESASKQLVLFPIRLDDAVMSTRDDWAAKIKRRRHIGDFSNWQGEGSYRKAFERLLRDLKAT